MSGKQDEARARQYRINYEGHSRLWKAACDRGVEEFADSEIIRELERVAEGIHIPFYRNRVLARIKHLRGES